MGFRDLLHLPRKHRRARSEARNEANPAEGRQLDLGGLPPSRSESDLRIEPSSLPTPVPSTSQNSESNGTRAVALRVIYLTTILHNTDNPASGSAQSVAEEGKRLKSWDRSLEQGAATSDNKPESSWKSAAYASAKVVVDVVKESSDVFVPLKSVAGGLATILKHYDVWSISALLPVALTVTSASDSQPPNNRIFDTPH